MTFSTSMHRLSAKLRPSPREWIAVGLLVSSYAFGAWMLGHRVVPGFVYLTGFHLIFSAVLLFSAHRPKLDLRPWLWLVLCYMIGWAAEYIGVHGQWLFGKYIYGDTLGPKWQAIPLVIGVNWIIVVYAVCGTLALLLPQLSKPIKVIIGAGLLVGLDYLIEPVAIHLDFWTWAEGSPPLRNYLGWALVGMVQCAVFFALLPFTENRLTPLILILQIAFFSYLRYTL